MPADNNSGIRFSRLFAEGLMVVVSILIAFALDAWWEERQLEQEMLEDLAIVEAELAENIRLIVMNVEMMERGVDATHSVIDAMFATPDATQIEVPGETVYWGLFLNPTLDLSLGAIDAWIAAGRLAGISDPRLRERLASVRGKVGDVTEEQHVARQLGTRDLYPLLAETLDDIRPLTEMFGAGFTSRQKTGVTEMPAMPPMTLPNTPALRLTLQARTLWYQAAILEMGDFQAELEEIQALLREELDR